MCDAATLLQERGLRGRYFPPELFADPAWDMLLDLYSAPERRVSVSSLCIAAGVPPTTALRWIGRMVTAGLIERHRDPADRRRTFVSLSRSARGAMQAYLAVLTVQQHRRLHRSFDDAIASTRRGMIALDRALAALEGAHV